MKYLAAALIAFTPAAMARTPPPPEAEAIPVALLVDASANQVLYSRQPRLRFIPASMAKVMTVYVAFEMMARNELRPNQRFIMSPGIFAAWAGKGTSMHLRSGESVPVELLLRGITTVSANDAAAVLAEGAVGSQPLWAARMNAEACHIGLSCSHFATPNGWPDNGATYVCAEDLVKLARALTERHPTLYRNYFGDRSMQWNGLVQRNKNPILGVVHGTDGIKTGYAREAGYNFLGSAARDGRRLIMVIGGARSETERALASRALLEWGFSEWRTRPLFTAGEIITSAHVQGGASRVVPLVAGHAIQVVIPKNSSTKIALKVIYKGPLRAPVVFHAQVAELEIDITGEPPVRIPLLAGKAVTRAGALDRLRNGLMSIFS